MCIRFIDNLLCQVVGIWMLHPQWKELVYKWIIYSISTVKKIRLVSRKLFF